jgi:hypothetical protein
MDMSKEADIKLDFPVQLPDRLLSRVTMRRPVMRDMLKHKIGPEAGLEEDMAMNADLCGLTPADLEEFDVCDYEKLQAQLLRFRGVPK